ncbi:MAG TPA: hypothetical protein VF209_02515 [Patescibacteria group bacterium]
MPEKKEPINVHLRYDLERGKQRYPQVRELIIQSLAQSGMPEQAGRSENEQAAWNYLVGQLENAMVAVLMRKPLDIVELEELTLELIDARGAAFDLGVNTIYLDKMLIEELYKSYCLLLESKAHADATLFSSAIKKLAEEVAKLVITITHQFEHELSHAHDQVHNLQQSLRSIFATFHLESDPTQYAGDPGEIEAQELALDILEGSSDYLLGDEEVVKAIDDHVYPYVINLKQEIAERKKIREQLDQQKGQSA